MRSVAQLILTLIALALPIAAQQPARAPGKTSSAQPSATGNLGDKKEHQSALKFLAASDVRPRLQQSLDKLLADGRQSLLQRNPGLDPRFADEWVKRMRTRVSLDDFVDATARVYEKYFTSDELDQLTQVQLAMKKGEILTLAPELGQKLRSDSPRIQRDINTQTSLIGSHLGKVVGEEIERDHPEWGKDTGPASPTPAKP